ncbi:MAG: hypothetical protein ACOYKC_09095 [Anaerolineaceae bacterium]|jgi:hypothetical protein
MARPVLPPKFVNVPVGPAYDPDLPDGVFRTYVQLRGLAWGKNRLDDVTIKEIMEVTGKSRSTIYGHLGILRDRGWLLFNSAHYSWLTVEFCGGDQNGEKQDEENVDKAVDKSSRFLDSLNEEVKRLNTWSLNSDIKPPPDTNNLFNSAGVVQKSGLESENLDRLGEKERPTPLPPSHEGVKDAGSPAGKGGGRAWEPSPTERVRPNTNGWHDVIDAPLEGKLERLGVFPQIYGQIAEAVRSGEWTVEQVKELADEVLDIGAGPGVFVFRLKNRVRRETQAEKAEKRRNKFVDAYLAQQEARNGA